MPVYQQEKDNMLHWQGRRFETHVEFYFLHLDLPELKKSLYLRFSLLNPKTRLGPTSAAVGFYLLDQKDPERHISLREIQDFENIKIDRDIFYFEIGQSAIYNSGTRGELHLGEYDLSWDLSYEPAQQSFYHLPKLLYHLPTPGLKFLAPNEEIKVSGKIRIKNEEIHVQQQLGSQESGTQQHAYGRRVNQGWLMSRIVHFKKEPSLKVYLYALPLKLFKRQFEAKVLRLYWQGQEIKFSNLKFWNDFSLSYDTEGLILKAQNSSYQLHLQIQTEPAQMIALHNLDANGSPYYIHHEAFPKTEIKLYQKKSGTWELLFEDQSQQGFYELCQPHLDGEVPLVL